MVKVQVPATSANLGPGFDCLGLALNLYARFEFTPLEDGLVITGCEPQYANARNLVYRAYAEALASRGLAPGAAPPHRFRHPARARPGQQRRLHHRRHPGRGRPARAEP